jgi:hypothetical protein
MSEGAILIPLNSIRLVDYLMIYTLVHPLLLRMSLIFGPDYSKLTFQGGISY